MDHGSRAGQGLRNADTRYRCWYRRASYVALVVLVACGPSSADREAFLAETESIPWPEEERLGAAEDICEYLRDFHNDFHRPLGEPYYLAFDDLHHMALRAGADVEQSFDINGAAVRHICGWEEMEDEFDYWVETVPFRVLMGESR